MNTPIDYSSRYSFSHFCCRVKQGKRSSEFLQKYTDSGTETTHLASYNTLVFKYVKISAGRPLLFIGAIREKAQNQILHNLAMFTSNVLNSKECYLMINIPNRNLASGCHLLKKIDQTSWRTTRRNYAHIFQIVCISSRFRLLHLLSCEFERSEVL